MPTFSVIVNTYNRALSLRETILGLRLQQRSDFEIVVVNGPSEDSTEAVLAEFAHEIRALSCPVRNLSVSRNIGLAAARGEYVAYIDDDAIAELDWLCDLEAGFAEPDVAAVGGHVFDPTGVTYQYRYASADRLGNGYWRDERDFMCGNFPHSFRFPYVQGTNMAYRRTALDEIGGFDEEFEYYLDEVDVCVRLIDRGYVVRQLERAYVHHKYLSSYIRPKVGVSLQRYPVLKNKVYFSQKYAHPYLSDFDIANDNVRFINGSIDEIRHHLGAGRISTRDFDTYVEDAQLAWDHGNERGKTAALAYANGDCGGSASPGLQHTAPARAARNAPAPVRQLCIVLLTLDYPPTHDGGIARYTEVLARGLAREGRHTVHVITRSESAACVDFIEGVWVHRLAYQPHVLTEAERSRMPLGPATFAKSAWLEIERIVARHPVDLIEAPLWNSQGYFAFQQTDIPTVVALQTPLAMLVREDSRLGPDSPNYASEIEPLISTDRECLQNARYVRAISHSILHTTAELYGMPMLDAKTEVVYLGSAPPGGGTNATPRGNRARNTIDILFVGRLEERKGIGTLLDAAVGLCERHPQVRLLMAGDTSPRPLPGGRSFEDRFTHDHSALVRAQRVQFLGRVDEGLLGRLYEEADIFVAPSTYESFGLVFTEAMSCALPCVGTNIGGIREVLGDDNARYLVAPGDTDALFDALSRLVADPDERARVGALNHRRWKELFSAAAMVHRTEAFFLRVASGSQMQRMQRDDGIEHASGPTNDATPIPTTTPREHAYATREGP